MTPVFEFESFDRPELKSLEEKYQLKQVIASGNDEFEKQIILKNWVNHVLPHGNNPKNYRDSLEILADTKNGQFYCSHYALVYLQCAIALGWYSRKIGIDYDHTINQEERHHGITDIWSSQFKKWFCVDPMYNLHFEKKGIPLDASEIRSEYLKNFAVDVEGIIGNRQKVVRYNKGSFGFDTPSNYFWFFVILRNNFFEDPEMYNGQTLLWEDRYNKDKTWFKGWSGKGVSTPHPMYESQFIKTNDPLICFPVMPQMVVKYK